MEILVLKSTAAAELGRAVLARADTTVLEPLAVQAGMVTALAEGRSGRRVRCNQSGRSPPCFGVGDDRRIVGTPRGQERY